MERFAGSYVESARDYSDRFVLCRLKLFDQCRLFACEPELATIGHNWEAYHVICVSPLSLVQTPYGVSKKLEGFESSSCSVAHYLYVM